MNLERDGAPDAPWYVNPQCGNCRHWVTDNGSVGMCEVEAARLTSSTDKPVGTSCGALCLVMCGAIEFDDNGPCIDWSEFRG